MAVSVNPPTKLSKNEYLFGGLLSGFVSRAVVQPLDVIKIRFQLQVEPIEQCKTSKYHGFAQAIRCINKEEGIVAFWKGHVPAQMQAIAFTGVQFLSFEILVSSLSHYSAIKEDMCSGTSHASSPLVNFFCGCIAGSLAALVTQPLDVLRTRFIAQGEPKIYENLVQAALIIAAREGKQGFFRGLVPSLLLVAPQTGIQFTIYHTFNQLVNKIRDVWKTDKYDRSVANGYQIGAFQSFLAGGLAGIGSKCIIYPLDMAKKRMQIKGFEEARVRFGRVPYSQTLGGCLSKILENEGRMALFKGLRPTLLKAFVSISCRFTVYEQFCHFMVRYHESKPPE